MLSRAIGRLTRQSSSLFFRPVVHQRFLSLHSVQASEWLKIAMTLENKGKIRAAEDIYKEIISENPEYEAAYQKLWALWFRTSSLRVTKKEMDNYMNMYETHISKKENSDPSPSPNI